jgi:signal peptidase I
MGKQSRIREWVKSIILAFLIATFIRTFFVQAFRIPSGSMENTLLVGDFLLVNKIFYGIHIPFIHKNILRIREPKRGDIVVFIFPHKNKYFVKRCIGLPGDTLEIKNKVVYINGTSIYESYKVIRDPYTFTHLPVDDTVNYQNEWINGEFQFTGGSCRDNFGPVVVPEGKIFLMGDNRDNSSDSRFWGPLDSRRVLGSPLIIYWSWKKEIPFYRIWEKIRWNRIFNFVY